MADRPFRGLSALRMGHMFSPHERASPPMIADVERQATLKADSTTAHRHALPDCSSSTGGTMNTYVLPSGKKFRTVRADIFNRALKRVAQK